MEKRNEFVPIPLPGKSVLIVDDLDVNLYIAKGLLEPYELNVSTCDNAICAINRVEGGEHFDLILMDHMMPGIDGMKATKALRKLGYNLPIVALTANAIAGQADMFLVNGFDAFLSKPIHTANLHAVLIRFLCDETDNVKRAARNVKDVPGLDEYLKLPEVAKQIFDWFVQTAPTAAGDIEKAIQENDMAGATRVAHSIRSMAGYMQHQNLIEKAKVVEMTLAEGLPPSPHDFERLKETINECLKELEAAV